MPEPAQLASILARAGAATRAWAAFINAGLDNVTDDPKVLTLKGRLLKDQARRAQGEAQGRLFLQSAGAYTDAAALHPDSYPLINAATMSLFARQDEKVALLARQVLDLLESGVGAGETPYWHDATRAEALLLLDKRAEAETALRQAIAHAPQAWEDHATTLRQFRAILAHREQPYDWLAAYAPPPSIYFKGIMGVAADDGEAAEAIAAMVAQSGAAFAYGALAAGADILIAEAVIRSGGELHAILPASIATFEAESVVPYGDDWQARFHALLEQAESVEIVSDSERLSSAAVELAAGVAKGRATDNAIRLESRVLPVEVTDEKADIPKTLKLPRSARPGLHARLPDGQLCFLAATNGESVSQTSTYRHHNDLAIAITHGPESGAQVVRQWRAANPDATIALHTVIGDDDSPGAAAAMQMERLVRAAAPGTNIATSTAAMLMKAAKPDLWIEPLGELPDPAGALTIYALGISI